MKGYDFPIYSTKVPNSREFYDLNDIVERKKYFRDKVGKETEKLKLYLENNTFIAYLLAKKAAGKGTYTKLFMEIFGDKKIEHISVGDLVRELDIIKENKDERKKFEEYLKENYRGFSTLNELFESINNRSTKVLLPTELILALVKKKIDTVGQKVLFIDGFPRNLDQVSYSLYFRDLINHRDDPDMFIIIDLPEKVIDERIKYRVVCPKCSTPRNTKLLPTKYIGYDEKTKQFYLMCDNPECDKERMVTKEGDELGIEAIRERLNTDEELIRKVFNLYGIPKILLRNSLPVKDAEKYVDKYEITNAYSYKKDKNGKIKVIEKRWVVKDDNLVDSYSLLAPAVLVTLIKQIVKVLGL